MTKEQNAAVDKAIADWIKAIADWNRADTEAAVEKAIAAVDEAIADWCKAVAAVDEANALVVDKEEA